MPKDAATETSPNPYRLPRTVVPVRYEVTLEPDLDSGTFVGEVTTAIDVREATNLIVLNAIELEIDQAWVDNPNGDDRVDVDRLELDEDAERLAITLKSSVPVGAAATAHQFPRRAQRQAEGLLPQHVRRHRG